MKQRARLVVPALILCLQGCVATVGAENLKIPPDSQQQCIAHCEHIGMALGAVAIMAENVGCVCQPIPGGGASAGSSAAITGGMATIAMQTQRRQQQQQQQRRGR